MAKIGYKKSEIEGYSQINDKINLQTNITGLPMLYYLLGIVRDNQPLDVVQARDRVFPLARAKIKSPGSDWNPAKPDEHGTATLIQYNLVTMSSEESNASISCSRFGKCFLDTFTLVKQPFPGGMFKLTLKSNVSEAERLGFLYEFYAGVRCSQAKYGRDIHPFFVLFRFLSMPESLDFITKREWAWFLGESSFKTDSQLDDIVKGILGVRVQTSKSVQNKKSTKLLSILSSNGILEDGDGEGELQKYRLTSKFKTVLEMKMKSSTTPTFNHPDILAAIRTKPFILLAGISGTGKTRIVRQLARVCCHEPKLVSKETNTCGNYDCIPVRPNWHDSTELLGYVTRITKSDEPPKYVLTPFVEFLAKAWTYREVPFFLCLDEMNLAPVEQYFAEYLSVVESREKITVGDGADTFECISSREKLVRFDSLEKETKDGLLKELFENKGWAKSAEHGRVQQVKEMFEKDQGIRLPPNLVVMGTVNMDETTCTFSRKVLDRAMSFELNDVSDMYAPANLAGEGDYEFGSIDANAAKGTLLTGKEAYDSAGGQGVAVAADNTKVGDAVLAFLENLNEKEMPAKKADGSDGEGTMSLLAKTPFKIAYRSRNEIMIYCIERIAGNIVPLPQALDEALSMKVLSRIEGDSQHVRPEWLQTLSAAIVDGLSKLDGYDADKCVVCKDKLADMVEQAQYCYTSFWMR